MTPLAVRIDAVSFSYASRSVLKGAGLELAFGELCALTGQNGAGKSTLMKLILGELEAQEGTVSVLGRTPSQAARSGEVGYVPQQAPDDYRSFPATVREVVRESLPRGRTEFRGSRRRNEAATHALHATGLCELGDRLIGELSGGQFQRALLARAIASGPRLLLLDEATSNLDDESACHLVEIVHALTQEAGMAALLVTHDVARLPGLFDRIVSVDGGSVCSERFQREVPR